jgi:hypothetical protein
LGFWHTYAITAERLNRLGPYLDCFVGTDGEYQTLNAAIAAGAKRIFLTDGATMSSNLSISASDGFIVGFHHMNLTINASSYNLTITGDNWNLEGFVLNTGRLKIEGTECSMERVWSYNSATTGIWLAAGDRHCLSGCWCTSATTDGLYITAGVDYCKVNQCEFKNNGGYGVNDLSNLIMEGSNYYAGNASGGINSSSPYQYGVSGPQA